MKKSTISGISAACILTVAILLGFQLATADIPEVESIWYNGKEMMMPEKPSAAIADVGQDTLFIVPGYGAVAASAPTDKNWNGGNWMVFEAVWNKNQRALKSKADVIEAVSNKEITVKRNAGMDFYCPIAYASDSKGAKEGRNY